MNEVPQQEPYPQQGYAYPYAYGPPTTYGYRNGMATAGMVLALAGIGLCWMPVVGVVSFILTGLAIVFGAVALRKVKRGESDARGRAHTALWGGIAGLILTAVFGVVYMVAINDASNDYDRYSDCLDHTRLAHWDRCDKYLD